jgi:hypothetical protein
MGRWHEGKGGLAHCEGVCQKHPSGEVGAAGSAVLPDLCSALPRFGRRVGADPIPFGACLRADDLRSSIRTCGNDGATKRRGEMAERSVKLGLFQEFLSVVHHQEAPTRQPV